MWCHHDLYWHHIKFRKRQFLTKSVCKKLSKYVKWFGRYCTFNTIKSKHFKWLIRTFRFILDHRHPEYFHNDCWKNQFPHQVDRNDHYIFCILPLHASPIVCMCQPSTAFSYCTLCFTLIKALHKLSQVFAEHTQCNANKQFPTQAKLSIWSNEMHWKTCI